jgi:alanyl-tRNA synthetase
MTEKLYINDSYIYEFKGIIEEIIEKEGKYHVVLDKTGFYPEGGGQPSDIGSMNGIKVSYVYIENGTIYHILDEKPESKEVVGKIDIPNRVDLTIHHSGQHLFSSIAFKLYNAATVGFHLTKTKMTVDLDIQLADRQVREIEAKANQLISSNKKVKLYYPQANEIDKYPLRKVPKVKENIRLVEIEETDFTPCGGTHVKGLLELKLFKIKSYENYKGGMRFEILIGDRAIKDYNNKSALMKSLTSEFSFNELQLLEGLIKLRENNKELSDQIKELKEEQLKTLAKTLPQKALEKSGRKYIIENIPEASGKDLKQIAQTITENEGFLLILASESDGKINLLVQKSKELDASCKEIYKSISDKHGLRGGGNDNACQGGGKLNVSAEELISLIRDEIV